MPWKPISLPEERLRLVLAALEKREPFSALCRRFGISRKCAYKWLKRFREGGGTALCDRSRRPLHSPRRLKTRWVKAIGAAHRRRPSWGAKKLCVLLHRQHPRARLPAVRTIHGWLRRLQLVPRRRARTRRGPLLPAPRRTLALAPNDVWTIDFKGWFRTLDGKRCDPLTVRDLFSRFILAMPLARDLSEAHVRGLLRRVFARYGLPRAIQVDNGAPFGGKGALGLSRLSVWWVRLGIKVEFGRRACPQDNAGHEQMHRVYKAEALHPPAATRRAQQGRTTRWIRQYNEERPHEALGQKVPAKFYRGSERVDGARVESLVYPEKWRVRHVRAHGDIKWQGRLRFIGRAFAGERIALKPLAPGTHQVYLGRLLIGHLHDGDPAGLRPARWQRAPGA